MSTASDLVGHSHNDIPSEFTFVWKITNFKYCMTSNGSWLESPIFTDGNNCKWQAIFYPRGNCYDASLICQLRSLSDFRGSIKYHFCICNTELELLYDREGNDLPFLYASISFRREIFKKLSDDALVLHFHLWKNDSINIKDMVHCFSETSWSLRRKVFSWKVENFNSLKLGMGEKATYNWKITNENNDHCTLELKMFILGENLQDSIIRIWLTFANMTYQTFTSSILCLMDENGSVVKYLRKEDRLGPTENTMMFSFNRAEIIAAELSNGNLIVRGEVQLSGTDSNCVSEGMVYGMKTNEAVAVFARSPSYSPSKNLPSSSLSADMLSLYKGEGLPSDFQLQVPGRRIPVHQLVLGARSTVFRAMFTNDMLERSQRSMKLTDIDADTTERMLLYIYTDEEPSSKLKSESLADLYAAADKYALMGLKEICAERLVQGLTVSSAPGVLKIADQHNDPLLKKRVVDYIISQGMVAIESESWKDLEQDDPKLSIEVLHQVIKRKKMM